MIYLLITMMLFMLRYMLMRKSRARDQIYSVILFGLFLFSAFRYEVGCDWSGYYYQYYRAFEKSLTTIVSEREPIWWLILSRLSLHEIPYPWINVVSSAVFFVAIHVLARRQPDRLGFLVLLFPILIINMPMSGIRQGAAIGIMSAAFVAFTDKKLLKFVLLTALASGFHASAMAFLLLAPLVRGNYTKTRLGLAALLAIPGGFILLGSESAELAVDRYIDTEIDAAGAAFRVGILLLSGIFFFAVLRRPWRKAFPSDYRIASIGSLMMIAMAALVPISSVIGDRLGYYLIPIQSLIFARIPYLPLMRHRALYIAAPYLGLFLVFTVWSLASSHFNQCYVPYNSWILGFPDGQIYRER
ncbi:EpsG family protein [Sedimentimonas flavescens]|uniref:EpsG family protein n=1 Tax=Sedimentimonas flavescens TaxID=2851012 RepID=A0ABT2ZVN5_9RHOB|nr:EpsG family protein [Sedimentimonas flavescens]MCV2877667.1 EpsG family protein [Sedimentimonas flavescens]